MTATDSKPIIYTQRGVLRDYLESDLLSYPLWIATDDGDDSGTPVLWRGELPSWKFKAVTATAKSGGTVPGGVTGAVDLNSFHGTVTDLRNFIIKPRPVITGIGGGGILPPVGGQIQFQVNSDQPQEIIESTEDFITWREHPPVTIFWRNGHLH